MGLLETLKSLLGRGESRTDRPSDEGGTTVTVEYEPDAETEAAVKGADVSGTTDADAGAGEAEAGTADTGTETGEADAATADTESADAEESPPVEEITGIGPTYASRLEAAGIETVADLAAADVGTVAEAAETAESRAGDWIEQARDR